MATPAKITLLDVKNALRDERFRKSLGEGFKEDMQKYLNNPNCGCNYHIYQRVAKEAKDQLSSYYPSRQWVDPDDEVAKLAQNRWSVINCKKDELEKKLKELGPGRKQLAVARYEDEVTVIVNDLDMIF
jgi:hypothetical protein